VNFFNFTVLMTHTRDIIKSRYNVDERLFEPEFRVGISETQNEGRFGKRDLENDQRKKLRRSPTWKNISKMPRK
jgi:hypothetical protein